MTVTSLASAATSNSPLRRYVIEPMTVPQIPAIAAIEQLSFSTSWPPNAYRREIERNQLAQYLVAKRTPLAGPPRREPRFRVEEPEPPADNQNLLARVANYFKADPPAYTSTEAEELETVVGFAGLWLMVDV